MSEPTLRREAVAGLYEAHGRSLLAYARSFCRDISAAEDIVHAIFVKLLNGSGPVPEAPLPYLLRAVRNTSLNARRQTVREVELPAAENWLEAPAGMEDEAMALQTALDTLPLEQREVVALRIWGQLSFEEVGQVVGCSVSTASSRFRYGCEKLRAVLQPLATEVHDARSKR